MTNHFQQVQKIAVVIRKECPGIMPIDDPTNPGYILHIEKLMGSGELEIGSTGKYVGRVAGIAETMGYISHLEADEIISGLDRRFQSEIANELITLREKGKIDSFCYKPSNGLCVTLKGDGRSGKKKKIFITDFQKVMDCLPIVQYLACTRALNRPQSVFA